MSDIWKRKKFGEVLETFGPEGTKSCMPCVFLCLCSGISSEWGINRLKTPKNHARQHRKTKLSEPYLSECYCADFGDKILRFAEFMKHFSGSLASCRDRPLQITNNVRVQRTYQ